MSLVSELPGIVDEVAVAPTNADGVLLSEEEAGMRVQVLASVPITAIRLGHAARCRYWSTFGLHAKSNVRHGSMMTGYGLAIWSFARRGA